MADKFLTTKNKKLILSIALLIGGWHLLIMGGNPLNLPTQPSMIIDPLFGGISILTIAGGILVLGILLLWTEY